MKRVMNMKEPLLQLVRMEVEHQLMHMTDIFIMEHMLFIRLPQVEMIRK